MKKVGKITEKECNEIYNIYEKRAALENLLKILNKNRDKELYNRASREFDSIEKMYLKWWDDSREKYKWIQNIENEDVVLYVDFEKCAIILDNQEN